MASSFLSVAYPPFDSLKYTIAPKSKGNDSGKFHNFKWTKYDSAVSANLEFSVKLAGDKIEGYAFDLQVPEAQSARYNNEASVPVSFEWLQYLIYLLLFFWLLFEYRQLSGKGSESGMLALKASGLFFVIYAASALNGMLASNFDALNETSTWMKLLLAIITEQVFVKGIFFGILVYFSWLVGEQLFKDLHQGGRLTGFQNVIKLNWLSPDVSKEFATGFFWACTLLGLLSIYGYAVTHIFGGTVDQRTFALTFDREIPWLEPHFRGIISAFTTVIILFFFLSTQLKQYLKHTYWVLVPILIILQFTGIDTLTFFPQTFTIIWRLGLGLILFYIYQKYNMLTIFMAIFISTGFTYAAPLFSTINNLFLASSGVSASILLIATLLVSVLGFRKNRLPY